MAASHIRQRRRKSSREPLSLFPDAPRWCSSCERQLPPGSFNKDEKNRDGLHSYCRECRGAAKKSAYQANPQAHAIRHVTRTYGIKPEQFAAMVKAQGNACAICSNDMGKGKGRHVDHCHTTGRVRALLCSHCNVAIGYARDDPALLRAMADYVEQHM